jgi:hypothetical protein
MYITFIFSTAHNDKNVLELMLLSLAKLLSIFDLVSNLYVLIINCVFELL